jgi:AraC-like DNA-binding protein
MTWPARFTTSDAAEGFSVLEEVYAVKRLQVVRDAPFTMAQSSSALGGVRLERLRLTGAPAAGLTDGTGVLRIAHVMGGSLTLTHGPVDVACRGPFRLPSHPFTSRWGDLDLFTVTVDLAAVQDHARRLAGSEGFRLDFAGSAPVSPAMARYWAGTVGHLTRSLLPNATAMSSPVLRAEAVRSLLTAALQTFPSTFLEQTSRRHDTSAAPGAVRRALAFIDEHLDADIGLAEIAEAARMSPRGLQAAFRRELDTTPLALLRSARLAAARQDLVRAEAGAGDTVEAIAARWRFFHRGRFAAAYSARYGESPATTLRT